ncbi:transporter substrate-binding domain-containing protein [Desulfurobacterium atlanticum]|uniref:Amino acid ABC transporter substrate-binding protein, PAAT family n=1 Tax=Desulfurobacterium atlanticum TaxID=240169 RepID=A0A238Y1J3_9BACT|nr:transporter substrate-binding domain-containing protein [Desulfurobacterium atlanticum]SNR64852.1 amino acid ABC transporter substrate-binding protein, PAAT family [Desulfurobacterium atlanticum]
MKRLKGFWAMLMVLLVTIIGFSSAKAGTLDKIKQRGYMIVGVKYDFKPFGFVNEKGEVVGFDIDLVKYIAKKLGTKVKLVQVTSKTRIPMLESGSVDLVAASMTHKRKRDLPIDFTISYYFDGQAILARSDCKAKSYKDFAGKRVAAIQGATSGPNFKKVQPKAKIVYFQEYPQALMALMKGKVDAITTDYTWCATQAKDSHGKLKVIGEPFTYEPYGMGVRENDSDFRDAVNFAIQDAVLDGTYAKIYKKWFGKEPTRLPEVWPK